jgi:FixJ family two-component response regulator
MTDGDAHSGVVFVIDDEASVRAELKELFESVGLKVIPSNRLQSFLDIRSLTHHAA